MRLERDFQKDLIVDLKAMFPGCYVLKTNPNYIQGIPDLIILYNTHWAALECKREEDATKQPNQPYYVKDMNRLSFAAFIYPENREEVLHELQRSFSSRR